MRIIISDNRTHTKKEEKRIEFHEGHQQIYSDRDTFDP